MTDTDTNALNARVIVLEKVKFVIAEADVTLLAAVNTCSLKMVFNGGVISIVLTLRVPVVRPVEALNVAVETAVANKLTAV